MVIFGVRTDNSKEAITFFEDTRLRLQKDNLIYNPFRGDIVFYLNKFHIISMSPIYPTFSLIGVFLFIISFVFGGLSLWLIPGILIASTHWFYTGNFFYLMLKKGLKKAGYKGDVTYLSPTDIMEELFFK